MKHVTLVVAKQRLNQIGQAGVQAQDSGQHPREAVECVDVVLDPHPCRVLLRRERRAPRGEAVQRVAEHHLRGFETADAAARPAGPAGKTSVEPVLEIFRTPNPVTHECIRRLREGAACPPQPLHLPKSPARGTIATRVEMVVAAAAAVAVANTVAAAVATAVAAVAVANSSSCKQQ